MKAQQLLNEIENMGIEVITGVPDSTLKQFCDGLQTYSGNLKHYVPANEGAAIGIAVGTFLATGKPACVYLQNSGIGNTVNPVASLANKDVYGIPMLFIVGWRGEPGVHDEPQHVFQGKITCKLYETMGISYSVVDKDTTWEKMLTILEEAKKCFDREEQYAIIVKKGTFEASDKFVWKNENELNREYVLGRLLEMMPQNVRIVSTTGKISRELYEQSNMKYGNHDSVFMTVGGMGHASMIAFGIAQADKDKRVVCIDGDGAALMHMGAIPFIAQNAPANYVHVVINNQAHESVGAMPTGCQKTNFARMAETAGYRRTVRIRTDEELNAIRDMIVGSDGPVMIEILVALDSRASLGRPKETAKENKEAFMSYINKM